MTAVLTTFVFLQDEKQRLPQVPLTCPLDAKAVTAASGTQFAPLERGADPIEASWSNLQERFPNLKFTDPPASEKLTSNRGKEIDNLVWLMKKAVDDPLVQEAFHTRLAGDVNTLDDRIKGIDSKYRHVVAAMLADQFLWEAGWQPSLVSPGGVYVLPVPIQLDSREYYMGAVFYPGPLDACKRAEYDLASRFSERGQNYTRLWPIKDMYLRGQNTDGDFVARAIFSSRRVHDGGMGSSREYLGVWQVVVDHFRNGDLLATYADLGEHLGDDKMLWLFGQHLWLKVSFEGEHLGFVVVSYVGFRSQIYSRGGWFGIGAGNHYDEPIDHKISLIAHLAGVKRRLKAHHRLPK